MTGGAPTRSRSPIPRPDSTGISNSEIPRVDHLYPNEEALLHSQQGDKLAPPHALKRQVERERCLLDSRHGSEPLHDGFIEITALSAVAYAVDGRSAYIVVTWSILTPASTC